MCKYQAVGRQEGRHPGGGGGGGGGGHKDIQITTIITKCYNPIGRGGWRPGTQLHFSSTHIKART